MDLNPRSLNQGRTLSKMNQRQLQCSIRTVTSPPASSEDVIQGTSPWLNSATRQDPHWRVPFFFRPSFCVVKPSKVPTLSLRATVHFFEMHWGSAMAHGTPGLHHSQDLPTALTSAAVDGQAQVACWPWVLSTCLLFALDRSSRDECRVQNDRDLGPLSCH